MTDTPPRFRSALPALVVPDVPAAVTFYRDVLGFRLPDEYGGATEFAIVDLAPGQGVHLKRGTSSPAWHRTLAVHVRIGREDLERLAAKLLGNGALVVSPPRDEPWGMREMRVADPNGYLVRFGAPLDEQLAPGSAHVAPEVPVADALAAAAFCRDVLGMGPAAAVAGSPYFQRSHRDHVNLHWWAASGSPFTASRLAPRNRERAGIWDVYVEVSGVDAMATELAGRGAKIQRGPVTTGYGMRELEIAGPDGCTICFGEDAAGVVDLATSLRVG